MAGFTIFHFMVIGFIIIAFGLWIQQKHKLIIGLMGLVGLLLGFLVEAKGVWVETWSWSGSGAEQAGVPYIVIATYSFTGILAGSFAVSPILKKLTEKSGDYFFLPFAIGGGIYFGLKLDFIFLSLVVGIWLLSKVISDTYILKMALFVPAVDILVEESLVYWGFLDYPEGYDAAIYMAAYAATIILMAATTVLVNWKEKRAGAKGEPEPSNRPEGGSKGSGGSKRSGDSRGSKGSRGSRGSKGSRGSRRSKGRKDSSSGSEHSGEGG